MQAHRGAVTARAAFELAPLPYEVVSLSCSSCPNLCQEKKRNSSLNLVHQSEARRCIRLLPQNIGCSGDNCELILLSHIVLQNALEPKISQVLLKSDIFGNAQPAMHQGFCHSLVHDVKHWQSCAIEYKYKHAGDDCLLCLVVLLSFLDTLHRCRKLWKFTGASTIEREHSSFLLASFFICLNVASAHAVQVEWP